jgi:glutamate racemase
VNSASVSVPSNEGMAKAYCTRLDETAQKLRAPLQAWGLSSLEEVRV